MKRRLIASLLLFLVLPLWGAENAVSVELVPLTPGVTPATEFTVAVVFTMSDGWHTYWRNPGDAGMASEFDWQLPAGFEVLSKREPIPVRHQSAGITTLIHENEAIYFFQIKPPAAIPGLITLNLEVNWLECLDICRPGSADLQATLPVNPTPINNRKEWLEMINRAESQFPRSVGSWPYDIKRRGDTVQIQTITRMKDQGGITAAEFFPYEEMVWGLGTAAVVIDKRRGALIKIALDPARDRNPERIRGVMVYQINSPEGPVTIKTIIDKPIR